MNLNTVILKVAAPCNLDCSYCYEYNRGDDSWRHKPKFLPAQTAEQVGQRISEYCLAKGIKKFRVNLHGGEPLLLGAGRLRDLLDTLLTSARGVRLQFGVQTNGTLVTAEILDVLQDYRVAIGVSIDGGYAHNRWRVDHGGRPAYDAIVSGLNLVRRCPRLFAGLLAVVDLDTEPEDVLDGLGAFEPPSIDFLPPFGNYDNPPFGAPAKYGLGEWMVRAFDHWMASTRLQVIRIRYLEDALVAVVSGESRSDWFGLHPPGYVVVATDGAFEGLDTLKVAGEVGRTTGMTVWSASFDDLLKHDVLAMRMRGLEGLAPECRRCPIVGWCGGGYLPTRFGRGNGYDNPSYYCADMQRIFFHVGKWLTHRPEVGPEVVAEIQRRLCALDAGQTSEAEVAGHAHR